MVTLDLLSSSLLRPFIIFTGKFGKNLMKKWQHYEGSIVLFIQNHWMTAETNILYLKYIAELHEFFGVCEDPMRKKYSILTKITMIIQYFTSIIFSSLRTQYVETMFINVHGCW